jgi:hypothetical protein
MKRLVQALGLLWLALVAADPALAEALREVPAELDPAKAYVLIEIRNQDDGRQRGAITLARYDWEGRDVRGGTRSPDSGLADDAQVRVTVRSNALARGEGSRLYLLALEPDTWVIEGAGATAFSLGSRTFTLVAGDVVDLGVFSPQTDWREGEGPQRLTAGRIARMAFLGPFARMPDPQPARLDIRERTAADLPVPEPLRPRIAAVQFRDGATFGNYLGGLVNRIDGRRGRPAADDPALPAEEPAARPPSPE